MDVELSMNCILICNYCIKSRKYHLILIFRGKSIKNSNDLEEESKQNGNLIIVQILLKWSYKNQDDILEFNHGSTN